MSQPNHTDRDHAEFSPSSLKYVSTCAGYEGRDGTSAAAEMGTRIHEALEVRDPSALHNEEELAIYEQIVEMEADFMSNFGTIAEEHNEIQVDVALDGTSTWGTCDRFLILESGTKAVMADYKTGISIIDPPEKNWQAKAYLLGAFQKYPHIEEITFVFYVPQHNACLHHTFKRSDMDQLSRELSRIIKAGETTRPKWESGTIDGDDLRPSQYCRFCAHEDACPALGGYAIQVAKKIDPSLPDLDISNLDNPHLASELYHIAKIVGNWSDSVKRRALQLAKDGHQLDGLKLQSRGRRRDVSDNKTFIEIAKNHGLSEKDILSLARMPVASVAKLIGAQYKKGERGEKTQNFLDDCESAGIIRLSDESFVLTTDNQ